MYHFNLLTEQNIHTIHSRPRNCHALNYSVLHEIELASTFQGFTIIYVAKGTEHHTLNGRTYAVGEGQYLLGNPHCISRAQLKSRQAVHGLCIGILPEIFEEVLSSLLLPLEMQGDIGLTAMLQSGDFLEHYSSSGTQGMGHFLNTFCQRIRNNALGLPDLNDMFFYRLAELYVSDYEKVVDRIRSVQAVKTSVRKDILRLLARSKALMDDCWAEPLSVQDIARAGNMSKYHFSRLFQSAYGMPPHRYLWQKRLEYGRAMLQRGGQSALDISLQCGFADLASFSKAYKQHFGEPPSRTLKISTI